jgi:predicted enzyme related to lactoylglutathione lyase
MGIKGLHAMFYATDAQKARAFLRDVVGWKHSDVGDGWLVFDTPEAEVGCHPSEKHFHELSFYCEDIEATVAELKGRGVQFQGPVKDAGFGLITHLEIPGAGSVMLYQPKYTKGEGRAKC